ncbi:MAG: SUMF1/EgtB/PvdO family nonheme iron enzyme, partial [Verrucomicrobiota bacterium]
AGVDPASGETPEERGRNGGDAFPWGVEWPPIPQSGNFADLAARPTSGQYVIENYSDGYPTTSPVGSFLKSSTGLSDLGGNVWEWVSDSFSEKAASVGVLRGGAWNSHDPNVLKTSYRNPVPMETRSNSYGFRFVLVSIENER